MANSGLRRRVPIGIAIPLALLLVLAGCDSQSALPDETVIPEAPRLTSPVNGSDAIENAVEFSWTADEEGTIYEIVVARDAAFTDLVTIVSDLQKPTFLLTGLEVGREYCWKVRARNAAGTGPWSSEWTFIPAREVHVAGVPQPLWPPHNMIDLPTVVTVEWTHIEGALTYDLQVAQEDVFIRRDADITGIETPHRELGFLVLGYEYFWRVRSRNHAGVSAWSPVRRFVIENSGDPLAPR